MSATTTVTETAPQAVTITAENILSLFPDIDTNSEALSGHDEEQIRLMDEVCIVLDEQDVPIGKASKKICQSFPRPAPSSSTPKPPQDTRTTTSH
jgi:isopentenyl-diphosphate delta-isomerase